MVFNHKFFEFINEKKQSETGRNSSVISAVIFFLKLRIVIVLLTVFECLITRILTLPIPIYSDIVLMTVTNLPGLPRMFGCYIRGLYYKGKLKKMAPNVLIEQGVHISHPENTELFEFAFLDKNVIVAANKCTIGRRVHIAPYVIVTGGGDFEIEDYACIATQSSIITSTETLKDDTRSSGPMLPLTQRDVLRGYVKICKDSFIGAKVTILTNVTIAEGTVIGSNTLISKNTEPWKFYIQSSGKAVVLKDRKKVNLPDI